MVSKVLADTRPESPSSRCPDIFRSEESQPEGAPGRMAGSDRPDEARMGWLVQAAEEARRRPAWSAAPTILRSGRRSRSELTDELESLLGEAASAFQSSLTVRFGPGAVAFAIRSGATA